MRRTCLFLRLGIQMIRRWTWRDGLFVPAIRARTARLYILDPVEDDSSKSEYPSLSYGLAGSESDIPYQDSSDEEMERRTRKNGGSDLR